MAQDLLDRFTPLHNQPINNDDVATLVLRSGHRAIKFPQDVSRSAYFASVMSSLFNSSGFKVTLVWTMPAVTAGVRWEVGFERHAANTFSFLTSSFGTTVSATAAAPAAANLATYTTLSFANGAQTDGILVLDSYRVFVRRRGDQDAIAQSVYLHRVIVQNLI